MLDWTTIVGGIATVGAVVGVVLNNRRLSSCFIVWLVSNTLTAAVHADAGLWTLLARDVIFLVLAVEGLWRWRKAGTMTNERALEYAAGLCREIAKGGVDEAEDAAAKIERLLAALVRKRVRDQNRERCADA